MDSKKRHELETNDLREFFDNFKDFWEKNGNSILIVLIVAVGGYVAVHYYQRNKTEKNNSAVAELAEAANAQYLLTVAEDHPSIAHIAWQRAGDAFLEEARVAAIEGGDTGTSEAPEIPALLDQASAAYQQVIDKDSHPIEFRINALLGLATASEMRGDLNAAKSFYDQAHDLAGDQFLRLATLAAVGRDGLEALRHPIPFGTDPIDRFNPSQDTLGNTPDTIPGSIPGFDPLFPGTDSVVPDSLGGDDNTTAPGFDPLQPAETSDP